MSKSFQITDTFLNFFLKFLNNNISFQNLCFKIYVLLWLKFWIILTKFFQTWQPGNSA